MFSQCCKISLLHADVFRKQIDDASTTQRHLYKSSAILLMVCPIPCDSWCLFLHFFYNHNFSVTISQAVDCSQSCNVMQVNKVHCLFSIEMWRFGPKFCDSCQISTWFVHQPICTPNEHVLQDNTDRNDLITVKTFPLVLAIICYICLAFWQVESRFCLIFALQVRQLGLGWSRDTGSRIDHRQAWGSIRSKQFM